MVGRSPIRLEFLYLDETGAAVGQKSPKEADQLCLALLQDLVRLTVDPFELVL